MRKSLAITVLSLYMLSFTECHQLLKLPLLIEHFREHSSGTDLTFFEFLVMHYETNVAHDDTDMQLPFKTCQHSAASMTVAILHQKLTMKEPVIESKPDHCAFYQEFIPSWLSCDIFQPPRA